MNPNTGEVLSLQEIRELPPERAEGFTVTDPKEDLDHLAAAGKKFTYLNELSRKLLRSGNPARKSAGQDIKHILEMEDEV